MDTCAVELIVIGFPRNEFSGDIAPAVLELVERGTIRVIDLVFISKDQDGTVEGLELTSVDESTRLAFESLLTGAEPMIDGADVADIGEALAPGSAAALVLFEHTWAREFRHALNAAGGELIDSFRISPEAIDEARQALSGGGGQ
ncbi:MAG: DUF6325 family protein [Acidimicrobiales bacterium]